MNDLRKQLERYLQEKKQSWGKHNKTKIEFFEKILCLLDDDALTSASLTDELNKVTNTFNSRLNLFYLRRERQASTESQSARWVRRLYEELGVPLDDRTFLRLVENPMTSHGKAWLKQRLYKHWKSSPFDPDLTALLEKELKGCMAIKNQKDSLAVLILNADTPARSKMFDTFKTQAPLYLIALIDELRREHSEHPNFHAVMKEAEHSKESRKAIHTTQSIEDNLFGKITDELERQHILDLLINDHLKSAPTGTNILAFTQIQPQLVKKIDPALIMGTYKKQAVEKIQRYLDQHPGAYKEGFFRSLINQIEKESFTVEQLNKAMSKDSYNDSSKLFAKWSGRKKSRSALLIKELYGLATLGKEKLSEDEFTTLVQKGTLPERDSRPIEQQAEDMIKDRVNTLFYRPSLARAGNKLDRTIYDAIKDLKGKAQSYQARAVPSGLAGKADDNDHSSVEPMMVEIAYQQYLLEKAAQEISEQKAPVFDPQGHVLLFLSLSDADYRSIAKSLNLPVSRDSNAKEDLERYLGPLTEHVFCNFDVHGFSIELEEHFKAWFGYDQKDVITTYLNSDERSSVIALQEEMSTHVFLALRVFEKKLGKSFGLEFRQELMQDVNKDVLESFQKAFQASMVDGQLDIKALNKAFDGQRKALAKRCRELLLTKVMDESKNDLNALSTMIHDLKKTDFTSTTATGLDYIRSDARNRTIVRISGTEFTAHDKQRDNQALRVLARNRYEDGKVLAYSTNNSEARVPSIAVLGKGAASHPDAIVSDIYKKLKQSRQVLQRRQPNYKGPLFYNLLTSLYDQLPNMTTDRANQQRTSAEYILKAVHRYNLKQLQHHHEDSLIFLENIPVNQHGNALSDDTLDDVTVEATLMSNMALNAIFIQHAVHISPLLQAALDDVTVEATLMSNMALNAIFYQHAAHFPPLLQAALGKARKGFLEQYKAYLFTPSRRRLVDGLFNPAKSEPLFYQSNEGKKVIQAFKAQREEWKTVKLDPAENLEALAVQALFKMYSHNIHYNKQYGMLVQALSVFVEPMSIAGCKSANERYQAVSGRVGLLKSLSDRDGWSLSDNEQKLFHSLTAFVQGTADCEDVQKALDVAYNAHNLQGAAASFSEEDQGAASKVEASRSKHRRGFIPELNTNVAETAHLKYLRQENTGKLQAHKAGLPETYKRLFYKLLDSWEPVEQDSIRP